MHKTDKVIIGENFNKIGVIRRGIGILFIYLPIFLLPFTLLSALLTYLHLTLIGAKNIKPLSAFIPSRKSHRYSMKTQITADGPWWIFWMKTKLFWILNCTKYCPISVAIMKWHYYLIEIVENFWCPFKHDKKETYNEGLIDKSFWHTQAANEQKLHPEDKDNLRWNSKS